MSAAVAYMSSLTFIMCEFNMQLYRSLCLLQGKGSAAVLQLTTDRQNLQMSPCLRLYLAENLIWLPEGRKDWKKQESREPCSLVRENLLHLPRGPQRPVCQTFSALAR